MVTELQQAKKPSLIILATPSWYTATALTLLQRFNPTSAPPILSLQWGVGNVERVTSIFGAEQVLVGVVTKPLHFLTSSDGHNTPLPSALRVGTWGGVALQHNHPLSIKVANLLKDSGLNVQLEDADALLWSSVFWGIQANALSSILDIPPAQVYQDKTLFAYEHEQLAEAWVILQRAGIKLVDLPGVKVAQMARQLTWLPRPVVSYALRRNPRPPSLRDDLHLRTGRSEAAYLNGAIAIKADQMGLQAPLNYALALTLTDIAEGRALWRQYQGNPQLLFATLRLAKG